MYRPMMPLISQFICITPPNPRKLEAAELAQHLRDANETLSERYDLMKAEVALKERQLHVEEKTRLYDRIAQEIAPQLIKADDLLDQIRQHPECANELFPHICVISAYIKRRANLILLGEEGSIVSSHELESCLRESLDNLRLCGMITHLDCRCEGQTNVAHIIAIYDLFENITELFLGRSSAMMVNVEHRDNTIHMRIQIGCRETLAKLPKWTLSGGKVSCEVQDDDLIIHALLPLGGEKA